MNYMLTWKNFFWHKVLNRKIFGGLTYIQNWMVRIFLSLTH